MGKAKIIKMGFNAFIKKMGEAPAKAAKKAPKRKPKGPKAKKRNATVIDELRSARYNKKANQAGQGVEPFPLTKSSRKRLDRKRAKRAGEIDELVGKKSTTSIKQRAARKLKDKKAAQAAAREKARKENNVHKLPARIKADAQKELKKRKGKRAQKDSEIIQGFLSRMTSRRKKLKIDQRSSPQKIKENKEMLAAFDKQVDREMRDMTSLRRDVAIDKIEARKQAKAKKQWDTLIKKEKTKIKKRKPKGEK